MAILNDHKSLILKERKSVDWKVVEKDWKAYFDEAGPENWRNLFAPVIQGVMTDRANALVIDFGFAFDVNNFYAREWFSDYTLQFAQRINDTTLTTLSNMLDQATKEGWSIPEMQNHMTTVFDQWMNGGVSPEEFQWYSERMPACRTENIARTESIRGSNKGAKELFRDNEVEENEWLATNDNRVRPEHWVANGQVRKLDEPFDVGDEQLMYPGDPAGSPENTCQCRCTLIPVIKEIGEEDNNQDLYSKIESYESNIANSKNEVCYSFDENGDVLFTKTGDANSISFTTEELAKWKDSIFTHNHPEGTSFSPSDIKQAILNNAKEMRAVGDKYLYTIKRPTDGWQNLDALQMYTKDAEKEVRDIFYSMIDNGTITTDEAGLRHYHEVWKKVSEKTGLIYDRTER